MIRTMKNYKMQEYIDNLGLDICGLQTEVDVILMNDAKLNENICKTILGILHVAVMLLDQLQEEVKNSNTDYSISFCPPRLIK